MIETPPGAHVLQSDVLELNGIIGTPNSHPSDMRFNAIRAKRIIFFEALLGEVVYLYACNLPDHR